MDPITLLAAFAPALVDGVKALVHKYLAPKEFKPATVEEYKTMRDADLSWFNAVNNAGGSGATYPWVEAVKQLQRPAVAAAVLGTWAVVHLIAPGVEHVAVDNAASIVSLYLFGDRTLLYARKAITGAG